MNFVLNASNHLEPYRFVVSTPSANSNLENLYFFFFFDDQHHDRTPRVSESESILEDNQRSVTHALR